MPNFRVLWTTDKRHIGYVFDPESGHIEMPNGYVMPIEATLQISDNQTRFISSNYVVDAEQIDNG